MVGDGRLGDVRLRRLRRETFSLENTRRRSRALPPRSVHIRDVYKSGLYDSSTSGDGDAGRSSLDGSDARARRWSRSGTTTSDLSSRSASDEGTSSGSGARSWSSVPVGREEAYVAALAATSPRERRRELRGVRFPKPREAVIDVADLVSRSGGDWDFACARARDARRGARTVRDARARASQTEEHPSRAVVDALAQCRSIAEGASVCHSPPLVDALAALEATLEKSLAKLPEERDADRGDGDGENDGVEAKSGAKAPNETDVDWRARVERLARALRRRVRQYEWASDALSRVDTFSPETAFYAVRRRSAGDEEGRLGGGGRRRPRAKNSRPRVGDDGRVLFRRRRGVRGRVDVRCRGVRSHVRRGRVDVFSRTRRG